MLDFPIEQRDGLEYIRSRIRCSLLKGVREMSVESLNKDQEFRFGHVDISSAENGLCKCGIHKTNKLYLSDCDVLQRATPCEKI